MGRSVKIGQSVLGLDYQFLQPGYDELVSGKP
jgi:hypothetical protein